MREMKDSGVEWIGKIPSEWDIIRMKSCIKSRDGGAWGDEKQNDKNDVICLRIADFDYAAFKFADNKDLTVRNYAPEVKKRLILHKGDILIEKSGGGEKTPVGRAVIFDKEYEALFANFMERLCVSYNVDPKFFLYILITFYSNNYVWNYIKQTTGIQNLDIKNMLSSEIVPLPNITTQRQIICYLDSKCSKIDEIIAKQEQIIEKLKEYKLSVITEAVTKGLNTDVEMKESGVDWTSEIPETWSSTKLDKCFSTDKGFAFKADKFKANGIPVVRVSEIKEGTVLKPEMHVEKIEPEYEKVILHAGDILMTTVGSHPRVVNSAVGQLARLPIELDGALLNQNAVCLRNRDGINKDYIYYFLLIKRYREHLNLIAHGTANQYSISLSEVLDFYAVLPGYNEQVEIADYLNEKCSNIEKIIANRKAVISKLQEYKKSLIYEVVTGKKEV